MQKHGTMIIYLAQDITFKCHDHPTLHNVTWQSSDIWITQREVTRLLQRSYNWTCSMYHSVIVLQTKRIPEFTATICDICINSGRPEHEPAQIAISARYSNPSAVTEEYCFGAIWGNTCWIWPGNDQWGLNVVHLPSKCIVQKSDSGPKALISWGECSKKWCFGFSLNPGNVDRRSSLCSATQEINGLFCMFWCHSQFNYIFKQHQNSPWTLSFWDIMHGNI